jgi:hypothetical protein
MLVKHPANHRIVQDILLRSALLRTVQPSGSRRLLAGARSIASLTYALRNVDSRGFVSMAAEVCSDSETPDEGSTPPTKIRVKIPGVGRSLSRIIADATEDAAADATLGEEGSVSGTLRLLEELQKRHFTYDDVCEVARKVEVQLSSGGFIVIPVGPHRRAAPFCSSVQLLCTHPESTAANDTERIYFTKVVQALRNADFVHPSGSVQHKKTILSKTRNKVHQTATFRVALDGTRNSMPGSSITPLLATGFVCVHWSPFDLLALRTLLLTGPIGYTAEFIAASAAAGFQVSFSDGLARAGQDRPITVATELELFSVLGLPYVHPVNRLEA